jgi:hypothetical protein
VEVQVDHLPGCFWSCSRYPKALVLDGHTPARLPWAVPRSRFTLLTGHGITHVLQQCKTEYSDVHTTGVPPFARTKYLWFYNQRNLTDARRQQLPGLVGPNLKAARDWAIKGELVPPLGLPSRSLGAAPLQAVV